MDDHIEEPLKEFNNTNSDKIHLWSRMSYNSQKKVFVLFIIVMTASVLYTYFFPAGCNKKADIKIEKAIN